MPITHDIVHASFRRFRRFVAHKESRCELMGNRLVFPNETIPSIVVRHSKKIEQ